VLGEGEGEGDVDESWGGVEESGGGTWVRHADRNTRTR